MGYNRFDFLDVVFDIETMPERNEKNVRNITDVMFVIEEDMPVSNSKVA